jgi:primosomal replication protein N''
MNIPPVGLVRLCPNCRTERPVSELYCEGVFDGSDCNWPLADEPIVQAGRPPAPEPPAAPIGRRCVNGHTLGQGDEICLTCGADPAPDIADPEPPPEEPPPVETVIDGWQVLRKVSGDDEPWERFVVRGSDRDAHLTLYRHGIELECLPTPRPSGGSLVIIGPGIGLPGPIAFSGGLFER